MFDRKIRWGSSTVSRYSHLGRIAPILLSSQRVIAVPALHSKHLHIYVLLYYTHSLHHIAWYC